MEQIEFFVEGSAGRPVGLGAPSSHSTIKCLSFDFLGHELSVMINPQSVPEICYCQLFGESGPV